MGIIPKPGLSAKAAQLDHGEHEIQAIVLGTLRDGLVKLETRQILR